MRSKAEIVVLSSHPLHCPAFCSRSRFPLLLSSAFQSIYISTRKVTSIIQIKDYFSHVPKTVVSLLSSFSTSVLWEIFILARQRNRFEESSEGLQCPSAWPASHRYLELVLIFNVSEKNWLLKIYRRHPLKIWYICSCVNLTNYFALSKSILGLYFKRLQKLGKG